MRREDVHYEDNVANNLFLVGSSLVQITVLRKYQSKIPGQSLLLYAVTNGRMAPYVAMMTR